MEVEYVKHHEVLTAYHRWKEAWPCPDVCDWHCFTGFLESPSPWKQERDGGYVVFGYPAQGARRIRLIANSPHYKALLRAIAVQYME